MARVAIPAGAVVTDDPSAPAAAPAAGRVPIPAGAVVTDEDAPKITRGKAALATSLQGLTVGTSDELGGVGGSIGEALHAIINEGRLPTGAELKRAYTSSRDEERATVAQAHHDYPKQSIATEIVGSLALPLPGAGAAVTGAVKAVGLGRKALAVAKGLAPAAAIGGVAGVGYQDSGEGKIASLSEDAGAGLTGAAIGAGGAAVLKGVVKGAGAVGRKVFGTRGKEAVKAGILDEIGRGPDGSKATPTDRAFLKKAGDVLYDEVVTGPDAAAVQKVVRTPNAGKALEWLDPVLDKLRKNTSSHYDKFAATGKHAVDPVREYIPRLQAKIDELDLRGGHERQVKGLEGIRDFVTAKAEKVVAKAGKSATDLRWFRALQTDFGNEAASKLGGLEPHIAAREGAKVAHKALQVFDEILGSKAKGSKDLQSAAEAIRANNQRMFGLLTLKKALDTRARVELNVGGPLERAGKSALSVKGAVGGGLGSAIGTAIGGPIGGVVGGLAGTQVPRALQATDRWLNSRAIDQLRAAATGQGGQSPGAAIKAFAAANQIPERQARAAYIRLVLGGKPEDRTAVGP